MTAPQFTSGPWSESSGYYIRAGEEMIAQVWLGDDATAAANARLIAAAPDLYRELDNAVVLLRAAGVQETANGTIRASEAVLAKVRGEQ